MYVCSGHLQDTLMEVNQLCCSLNMPQALETRYDADGNETLQGLPPYNPRSAYLVDEYPAAPAEWMRSSGDTKSYFVAVKEGHGMWLDFNANFHHPHQVAIVISIQGINAVSGLSVSEVRLEQYKERCPVHSKEFGPDRFCEKCGWKWPKQNYLATTGTHYPLLWLDGFRARDGVVRQYVFTKDTTRGVAAQIIGEKRVFALGIAFFLSKDPKPVTYRSAYRGDETHLVGPISVHTYGAAMRSLGLAPEVAAGARISQEVYGDEENLDFWQTVIAGRIVVNYVYEEDAQAILKGGKKDLAGSGEGFMAGLKVGNPFEVKVE